MIETQKLTAADVMHQPVHCASPDDRLADLEHRLLDEHVSGMPVVEDDRLVGVVSRSEFVRVPLLLQDWKAYAQEEQTRAGAAWVDPEQKDDDDASALVKELPEDLRVRHVMPSQVITCSPETPVASVGSQMLHHHVHRIIVVRDDRPVGIISSLDLVRLLV